MDKELLHSIGNQTDPKIRVEIQLGEELLNMTNEGNFLLADDESSEKM